MRMNSSIRTIAATMAVGMVVAACGQKQGIEHIDNGVGSVDLGSGVQQPMGALVPGTTDAVVTDPSGEAAVDTTENAVSDSTSATTDGDTSGATPGSTTESTSVGSTDTTTTQPSSSTQPSTSTQPATSAQPATGTRPTTGQPNPPGVTPDKITLAIHAPATGAAPLPVTSFEKARNTYWQFVTKDGGTVLGRGTVEVLFQDDRYAPDSAIQVCKELAAKSFLLVGGGGTDQIQACGVLAQQDQVPYFSAGVTENKLKDNPWYFAASMTYKQQGGLLAQYVKKNPNQIENLGPNAKIGTIITDTPNFKDALEGWENGLTANGLQNIDTFEHTPRDNSWYAGTAKRFKDAGITTVYFLSSPVDYINFAKTANERFNYNPQYIGVGISKAINAVLGSGCGDPDTLIDNGIFLHPYPGLDKAPQDFIDASRDFGAPADDIALALWGLNKAQHKLLIKYGEVFGNDLTRKDFRDLVEGGAGTIKTDVYPDLSYAPGDHFGADTAYVLQADCESKTHKTIQ
ncbi:MAG: hypothetical protein ACI970_001434, partial [Myxococcota bacterium]